MEPVVITVEEPEQGGAPPSPGPVPPMPPPPPPPRPRAEGPAIVTVPAGGGGLVAPDEPRPTPARTAAGVALVAAFAGGLTGALLGGFWGAGAGIFGAGAIINGRRALMLWSSPLPPARLEASRSATMAALGLLGSGYLGYKAWEARKGADEETE